MGVVMKTNFIKRLPKPTIPMLMFFFFFCDIAACDDNFRFLQGEFLFS